MPYKLWSGFLSWRITLFSLAEMGLTLFFNLDAKPRLTFMLSTLPYLVRHPKKERKNLREQTLTKEKREKNLRKTTRTKKTC
jgi:hypothetical protein